MFDGEIVFRGIPWGTSATEALKQLPKPQFSTAKITVPYSTNIQRLKNSKGKAPFFDKEKIYKHKGIGMICEGFKPHEPLTIASHRVNSAYVYFASVPQNGKLTYKPEDTAMFSAVYCFEETLRYGEANKMFKVGINVEQDILSKFILIYGEPDTCSDVPYDGVSPEYHKAKFYTWKGQNDTELVIFSIASWSIVNVYAHYIWHKGDELLAIADKCTDVNSIEYKTKVLGADGI